MHTPALAPTTAVLAALILTAGGCLGAAQKQVIGTWADPGAGAVYTFEKHGGKVEMTDIVDRDGEHFEVVAPHVGRDGELTWIYRVPSTGYVVTGSSTETTADVIAYAWTNEAPSGQQNSGTDRLERRE